MHNLQTNLCVRTFYTCGPWAVPQSTRRGREHMGGIKVDISITVLIVIEGR